MFLQKIFKKGEFFLLFFLFTFSSLSCLEKAVWATPWDIQDKKSIDKMLEKAASCGINTIIAEARYRGDALYFPNKFDNAYTNNEPRHYNLSDDGFDPLGYLARVCPQRGFKLVAWLTTFVITGNKVDNIGLEHSYLRHNYWITCQKSGQRMQPTSEEGAYFDPGIPAVQEYLYNVYMDVVSNYKLDGIQMDYIRYPNEKYGYNPQAMKVFQQSDYSDYQEFKRDNITNFVRRVHEGAKSINPQIEVSTAVFADYDDAYYSRSQDWVAWLKEKIVDKVYLMAYAKEDKVIKKQLKFAAALAQKERVVFGLRAWDDENKYTGNELLTKIRLTLHEDFAGIAFFSYYGIKTHDYYWFIKRGLNEQ